MDLPEGWAVGQTKKVSSQWFEQWFEYVAKAATQRDVEVLNYVLEDRRLWVSREAVERMNAALEQRAQSLGASVRPVRPSQRPPMPNARKPIDLTDRMTGERG